MVEVMLLLVRLLVQLLVVVAVEILHQQHLLAVSVGLALVQLEAFWQCCRRC
jgi:hypothetical protein